MNNIVIQTPQGKREIGNGQPVFIIAEMSCNHNQSYKTALKLINEAHEAGADAVKLQTYTADTLTIDSDKEYFQIKVNNEWKGQSLYSLYKKAYTPWEWQPKLVEYGTKKGIFVFSTPFDIIAVNFLEENKINELYKVASFEIVDIPLLKRLGQTKKPVIMSQGMATEAEIELAVKTLRENGCPQIGLLQCISSYPAKPKEMNLATIPDMVDKYGVIVGLSDHSLSNDVSLTSVSLGASIVEKHFILDRSVGGLDAAFSIEPKELKTLVKDIRKFELGGSIKKLEEAIGKPSYGSGQKEKESVVFRKSLFAVKDIKKGEKLTAENIRSIRPGNGLMPKHYDEVIDKIASVNIERGTPLNCDLIK